MQILSGIVVAAFACFLLGLAGLIFVNPSLAKRFLNLFASSASAHYTEQLLRLLAGSAIVIFSPSMWFPTVFNVFGWTIVATAVALLLVPWRWHHRFGRWAIPLAIRYLKLYAVGAFILAVLILCGVSRIVFN